MDNKTEGLLTAYFFSSKTGEYHVLPLSRWDNTYTLNPCRAGLGRPAWYRSTFQSIQSGDVLFLGKLWSDTAFFSLWLTLTFSFPAPQLHFSLAAPTFLALSLYLSLRFFKISLSLVSLNCMPQLGTWFLQKKARQREGERTMVVTTLPNMSYALSTWGISSVADFSERNCFACI